LIETSCISGSAVRAWNLAANLQHINIPLYSLAEQHLAQRGWSPHAMLGNFPVKKPRGLRPEKSADSWCFELKSGVTSRFNYGMPLAPILSWNLFRVSAQLVLLVDDNPEWREILGEFLALHGYTVQFAANGSEALELSKRYQTPPELILLDLNMPILDGWGFLAARDSVSQLAKVPVVVMSASIGIDRKAKEAGATAVLQKPIAPQTMLRMIELLMFA
jgi:two-component system chemotaxis response regulator CheY